MTRIVSCPNCKTDVVWSSENRYRPFCGQVCRERDLGAWATERYVVATAADPESVEEARLKDEPSE